MSAANDTSFGFVELHGGTTRVRIVPDLGGKIVSLHALGREWLWMSDDVARPALGVALPATEWVDSGGFDDCFPTRTACQLPSDVAPFGGLTLAEHGDLWSERPDITVEATAEGQQAVCAWKGRRRPYRFVRAVKVASDGTVLLHYRVTNEGTDPLPFIWTAHAVLPMTGATRVDVPVGARVRVGAVYGTALRGLVPEFRWPTAAIEKASVDFSRPDLVARRYACQLFVENPEETDGEGSGKSAAGASPSEPPEAEGRPVTTVVAVEEGDARLEVRLEFGEAPHLGLWLNKREWISPHPLPSGKRAKAELNLVLQPGIGSSDSLADALGRRSAQWLAAGETRTWTSSWRAVRTPALQVGVGVGVGVGMGRGETQRGGAEGREMGG